MPGSCSSSELNGCASCGPNLNLFVLNASTSQEKVGFGCLNGDFSNDPFGSKIGSGGKSRNAADNVICYSSNTSLNYSHNEKYSYAIDEFGIIAIGLNAVISMNFSDYAGDGCDIYIDGTAVGSYFYQSVAKKNSCEEDRITQDGNLGSVPGNLYCTPNPGPVSPDCSESCNNIDTCTISSSQYTNQCDASTDVSGFTYWANSSLSEYIRFSLNENKNLSFFYNLCKSSVEKKMSLLESNGPQNCQNERCGDGKKDDCWGSASPFSIVDNNLDDPNANSTTSQKLKFKIAAPKEEFGKKYKSISGRVIFYYGGTEGKTPCCDDDFDGTIVEEKSYSISSGPTFKDDYFAVECGGFDNDDQSLVGETINICYTIDNIYFI
jgi:hypothetical protein